MATLGLIIILASGAVVITVFTIIAIKEREDYKEISQKLKE